MFRICFCRGGLWCKNPTTYLQSDLLGGTQTVLTLVLDTFLDVTRNSRIYSTQRDILSGPEVIKHFSCSTQLSMKIQMLISIKISRNSAFSLGSDKPRMLFFPLIIVKMPTIVGILTFMSRKNFMLS